MFLAEKTVKNYVSALFAKLGMERRTQAAAYAVRVLGERDGAGHGGSPAELGTLVSRPGVGVGRHPVPGMDVNGPVLEQLPRDECLRLMGSVPVGRIVYTRQALPAVELVNFKELDDDGGIIIKTDAGGKLEAAARGAVVAFEADSVDAAGRGGWSVTVVGHATAVTDGAEVARLEQLPLTPWAAGNRDHFIRVSPAIVNGRRIGAGQAQGTGDARRF